MDKQAMMKWVDAVWVPYTKDPRCDGRDTYLLQDGFSVHLMGSVNNQINKLVTEVDIIPCRYKGLVQVLDKVVNTPFKGYLREQFEEWMCMNGSRRRPSIGGSTVVANAWDQVMTATTVDTWKSIGHKVTDDDDDDEYNIVANQPGVGQESTGDGEDEEAKYFILYQVEDESEAPSPLLQHNFDNDEDYQPFVMDLTEEERQQARDFNNDIGFIAV
jgi:hypothetical protein